MFERLINNGFPYATLELQHRMRTEISRTLMPHFYPNLRDHPRVQAYPNVNGLDKNIFFYTHTALESADDSEDKSKKNDAEAGMLARLALYLRQQDYKADQINVLACYVGQALALKRHMRTSEMTKDIRVAVVDNYQGEECDIILLSMVRSNKEGKIGFLKTPNRVCVALSRAKQGFYVLGNFGFLAQHSSLWSGIVDSVRNFGAFGDAFPIKCAQHGTVQAVRKPGEFDDKAPEGGCREFCLTRLDCGHACEKRCHAYDRDHKQNRCPKDCPRKCARDLHPCRAICAIQPCPPCKERALHELPCGHQLYDRCSKETADLKCREKCPSVLVCGHPCAGRCSDTCPKCQVKVEKELKCGHIVAVPCHRREEAAERFRCKAMLTKTWPHCGHSAEVECRTDVRTTPCPEPCGSVLANCGHVCEGTCGECRQGRVHVRCQQKCQQILVCGHACSEQCSEGKACGPCTQPCQTSCPHSVCGEAPGKGASKKSRKRNGRRCGEPCPPCEEPCAWTCPHHKCQREISDEKGEVKEKAVKCWEPCARSRCEEPCSKLIDCSKTAGCWFRCRGVCEPNEPCLDICPECQPKEWDEIREIFFGTEEEEDTLFYRLRDCGHVLAVKGLDQWVETQLPQKVRGSGPRIGGSEDQLRGSGGRKATEITVITCPKCKTPIRRSLRYGAEIKAMLADIEHIKRRQLGNTQQLQLQKQKLLEKQQEFVNLHLDLMRTRGQRDDDRKSLMHKAAETMFESLKLNSEKMSAQALQRYENSLNLLLELQKIWNKLQKDKRSQVSLPSPYEANIHIYCVLLCVFGYRVISSQAQETAAAFKDLLRQDFVEDWLLQQLYSIADFISKSKDTASERMLAELEAEVERLELLQEFVLALLCAARNSRTLEPQHFEAAKDIATKLNSSEPVVKEKAASLRKAVVQFSKDVGSGGLGISEEERKSILSAFAGMGKGHWFKCPNGHLYVITECGGAMEEGTCPECKARIGGGSHRLRSDNALAPEMDGAIQPAWPLGHP